MNSHHPTAAMVSDPATTPDTVQDTESKSALAPQWKVILHNDDTTTMEFVIHVLVTLFHKSRASAVQLMLEVHHTGTALVTVTTLERAELYVEQVRSLARGKGYPLAASMEPA